MDSSIRPKSHFARHVLATVIVAAGVCGISAALGHGDNIPLILLAAPIVGVLDATAIRWRYKQRGQ
ncbi:hypothetical protein SAMN04487766_11084 [Actinomyces ruminicola]|uniref:Uncharacterized protein n=1 Tax=Actinomyces ruminicola TaxID=332524 RepID=A0A1G9XTR9_9ACTO|nr:hypothetical protein SAMN04487766_11084 [Actinomyces ruminicola]